MNRQTDKKWLPIRLLSIEAEGFSFFQRQEIILHKGISIVNGENGSGKTTLLNMFRLLFGARRFDNHHSLKTFFERNDVDEIYILGRIDNSVNEEVNRRPFETIGKTKDVVTIVCRLINDQQPKRDYLIYDGLFDLERDLKDNHRWLDVGQYLKQMAEIGMSRSLVNLFSLNQGNTEEIFDYSEEQLADYLLQISGEQERIEKFNQIKSKLKQQMEQFHHLSVQKQQEEVVINNILNKIERMNEIAKRQKELDQLDNDFPLAKLKKEKENLKDLEDKADSLQNSLDSLQSEIAEYEKSYRVKSDQEKELSVQLSLIKKEIEICNNDLLEIRIHLREKSQEIEQLEEFLQKYSHIPAIPINELEKEKQIQEDRYRHQLLEFTRLDHDKIELEHSIQKIEETKEIQYPDSINRMRELLAQNNIEHLLLAEHIEVTDPEWGEAIEALLGQERFTIVVPEERLIEAMKWAQKIGYTYWISPYMEVPLSVTNDSILNKVRVLDNRITGYLQRFAKYMASANANEAWKWSKKGYYALVNKPNPYQVTDRGGRTIKAKGRYCGKMAYEAQLQELKSELKTLIPQWEKVQQAELQAKRKLEQIQLQIEDQQQVRKIPKIQNQLNEKMNEFQKIDSDKSGLQERYKQFLEDQEKILDQYIAAAREMSSFDQAIKDRIIIRKQMEEAMDDLVEDVEKQQLIIEQELRKLDANQKELFKDAFYMQNLKEESFYDLNINHIKNLIKTIMGSGEIKFPEDANLPLLEEKYRTHERILHDHQEEIAKVKNDLEKLENEHKKAQTEYMEMVEEVFNKIKRSLAEMASEGGINATLRPVYLGEDQWKVDYRIGFHGKESSSYRNKNLLSGGQKVIASLLLTLAAIKADGVLSFMLLDEPFAHLDRDRIQLAGDFLKKTGAQYIIAMPYTENIKLLMPAADMSINLRPKHPDSTVAPPITFGVINDEYLEQHSFYRSSTQV